MNIYPDINQQTTVWVGLVITHLIGKKDLEIHNIRALRVAGATFLELFQR